MHTHHSHSGQFCQHAKNTLEEMVSRAIERNFDLICLTEHMPRIEDSHLYPEEVESHTSVGDSHDTFDAYIKEAHRLRKEYGDKIDILIGFEGEGIDDEYLAKIEEMASVYDVDSFVGSLHHSDTVPIDFDLETWNNQLLSNTPLPDVVQKYFQRLQIMLERSKPPVIGHYDSVRLFAPNTQLVDTPAWPYIESTIKTAIQNDCMFEVNSSAIRKGWSTPYPQKDIASYIVSHGGKLCLSDDSHNVDQVGLNYQKVSPYLQSLRVTHIWRLKRQNGSVEKVPVRLSVFEEWVTQSYK